MQLGFAINDWFAFSAPKPSRYSTQQTHLAIYKSCGKAMKIFTDAKVTLELLRCKTVANFVDSKQDCVQVLNMHDNGINKFMRDGNR